MMKLLRKIFFSRLVLLVTGCVLVAVIIWFVGPLLGVGDATPLSGVVTRALGMCLLPVVFGLREVILARANAKANENLATEVAGSAAGKAEVEELSGKFKE